VTWCLLISVTAAAYCAQWMVAFIGNVRNCKIFAILQCVCSVSLHSMLLLCQRYLCLITVNACITAAESYFISR